MSRTALALLILPLTVGLTGCAGNDPRTGQILGQAVQVALQLVSTNQPNAPLSSSVTSQLPGGSTGDTGSSSLLGQFQNPNPPGPFDQQPLTLQNGVTGTGSAANNALALTSASAQRDVGPANDGRLTFTQYGSGSDSYLDGLTAARKGNRGNTLRASSLALSPNLIRAYGLKGGEAIYVKTAQGSFYLGTYDDTTGNSRENNVIDVYDPTDRLGQNSFLASIPRGGWQLAVGPKVA